MISGWMWCVVSWKKKWSKACECGSMVKFFREEKESFFKMDGSVVF